MERSLKGIEGEFDVAIYAPTHKPRIDRDEQGRVWINPGETSGWSYGNPTVVLFETTSKVATIVSLRQPAATDLVSDPSL